MDVQKVETGFAGRITGIDLRNPLTDEQYRQIDDGFNKYGVVVFPDQKLDNETQGAFGRYFGELEESVRIYRSDNKHRINSKVIMDVSNLDENSKPRSRDDRRRLEMISNMMWHADASYRPVVGALSMLYAHAVPPSDGETEFADMRAAYDALSDKTKAKIEDLVAEHVYGHSRSQIGFPNMSDEERQALPPVRHPIVRLHVGSGRKSLYIGSHCAAIVDWLVPEGRLLLQDLLAHATESRFVYRHSWKMGDLVVWDNRCTLHRGRPYDETYPRDLRRVTTKDGSTRMRLPVLAEHV